MLPEVDDAALLAELAAVVSAGWELPSRPQRLDAVPHLLLLVPPGESRSRAHAAQRLLKMLDDAILTADDESLAEDERRGLRILLGLAPGYRTDASPRKRRAEAAPLLIPEWQERAPADPDAAFHRRHQAAALRQVLHCLRLRYGQDPRTMRRSYDVVRARRWCHIDKNRLTPLLGERAEYRVRRDGLRVLKATESAQPEGMVSLTQRIRNDDGAVAAHFVSDDVITTTREPRRQTQLLLPRPYLAGEHFILDREEQRDFGENKPLIRRDYLAISTATNDGAELEVSVTFAKDLRLPDLCWWFTTTPDTNFEAIGPYQLTDIVDVSESRAARHAWSGGETWRWIWYGIMWVWFDDDAEALKDWETARARLERESRTG